METWYTSAIFRGDQIGRQFVYPTINLDPAVLPTELKRGVFACFVKLSGQKYQGALYFGPRVVKNETNDVLEIYLLDFTGEIEAQSVEFSLEKYLRGVKDFPTLEDLRLQVTKDIEDVRKVL